MSSLSLLVARMIACWAFCTGRPVDDDLAIDVMIAGDHVDPFAFASAGVREFV